MNKLLTLLCVLNALACNSYAQKMPQDWFDEGAKAMEDGQYDAAYAAFGYIVRQHPRHTLMPRAFYNLGFIDYKRHRTDSAMAIFQTILTAGFNEREKLGGSIMADPYTNYRHRAASLLSDIYEDRRRYDSALRYLYISDTVHPYLHFCGNELSANRIHYALRYARLYQELGQWDQAIRALLPEAMPNYLAGNQEVIDRLGALLKARGYKAMKPKLDQALLTMHRETRKWKSRDEEEYEYTHYYFRFLDYEFTAPEQRWNAAANAKDKKDERQEAIDAVKESAFYTMIAAL